MAIPLVSLLFLFFFFFPLISPSSGEISFNSIQSDTRRIISFDEFGFTNSGRLELNVSSISLSNPNADLSKLGFFLTTRSSWLHVVQHLQDSKITCALDSNLVQIVFSFTSLRETANSSFSTVFSDIDAGEYSLVFANCLPELGVSMDVNSAMYNLDRDLIRRNYLPAGLTALPRVYSLFALVYFAVVFYWISICYTKRLNVTVNHFLVFAALIMRALILLIEAENKSLINRTGRRVLEFNLLFYISLILRIGVSLSPHPMYMDIFKAEIDESGPNDSVAGEFFFALVELMIICVAMFAIRLRMNSLEKAAKTDEKAAGRLNKLIWSRNWFVVIFGYMCFLTGLVVNLVQVIASYKYMWTSVVAQELANLAFYLYILGKLKVQ